MDSLPGYDRWKTTPPAEPRDVADVLQDLAHDLPDEAAIVLEHVARLEADLALARGELANVRALGTSPVWVCAHCGMAHPDSATRATDYWMRPGSRELARDCDGCETSGARVYSLDLRAAIAASRVRQ